MLPLALDFILGGRDRSAQSSKEWWRWGYWLGAEEDDR